MPPAPAGLMEGYRLTQYRVPTCMYNPDPNPLDSSMDIISGSPHVGSHIDALVHVASLGQVFGGRRVQDVYSDFGWKENGVDTLPPIVTRGILLDVARQQGVQTLPDDYRIGPSELRSCLLGQGVAVREGDAVLVRTAMMSAFKAGDPKYMLTSSGITREGAIWLYDQGLAVLGSDTSGTEALPITDLENTLHVAMLIERGVPLVEILDLDGLATDEIYEFLFVCTPIKFVGATGSWIRPIAVV